MTADVTLAANGDRDAFVRLVDAYASTVTGIALAIVRDLQASQDIAQEVFLVAWRDLKKLRNPSSFLPWVRQMTRNLSNSWLRDHMRVARDTEAILEASVDPRLTPDVAYERAEQQRIIDDVIGALPDEAREVITLYYKEGRSVAQVADLLGLSEVAVKKRMSRARERIREELLERFGETVRATAPGAAFTLSVAAALSIAAPASAATSGAAAAKLMGGSPKLLALFASALPGAIAGGAGVLLGVRKHLQRAIDDQERRELRQFGRQGVLLTTVASLGFAVAGYFDSKSLLVVNYVAFVATMMWLMQWRLPRITARRVAMERERDPIGVASREKRDRLHAIIGCTLGLGISALTVIYCLLFAM